MSSKKQPFVAPRITSILRLPLEQKTIINFYFLHAGGGKIEETITLLDSGTIVDASGQTIVPAGNINLTHIQNTVANLDTHATAVITYGDNHSKWDL